MGKYITPGECNIGYLVREKRRGLKVTQKQLAEAVGCTFQQIQKYESGRSKLSVQMFLKICSYLRTNPSYFFGGLLLSENNGDAVGNSNAEARLLSILRSVESEKVRAKIVELVEAVVSSTGELS
ncbi:MAG: helix-turn-helix domain-containing protein [Holosporales bacterium]|jgi:transcriptional regulator with XRE-family HTH domain|nr:helix-turn-helix domain-containing protein [Holosporales bacterium]